MLRTFKKLDQNFRRQRRKIPTWCRSRFLKISDAPTTVGCQLEWDSTPLGKSNLGYAFVNLVEEDAWNDAVFAS